MRRFRHASLVVTLLGLGLLAPGARADIVDAVNAMRHTGCGNQRGGLPSLQRQPALNAVARRLAAGAELGAALAAAGYRADTAFSVQVQGADSLVRDYCPRLLDARMSEAGAFEQGQSTWVVIAAPADAPALDDPGRVAHRILGLVNAARARRRNCGTESYAATGPLAWSDRLTSAASAHALDMEGHDFFDHTGSDGSDPITRVSRTGYRPRATGENLAFNQESPEEVVRGWLASPHHCANIMDPRFHDLGVAYVISRRREQSIYWVLTLGTRGHL